MNEEPLAEEFIRGFSKPLILWLLCVRPMYGYNLMKEFKNLTGRKLKPATVYPFLHTLEKGGYLVGTWRGKGKRRIRNYAVTKKGRKLLSTVGSIFRAPVRDMIIDLLKKGKGHLDTGKIPN